MTWYNMSGRDQDIVLSSRIRFARNLEGYAFGNRLSDSAAEEIIDKVGGVLLENGFIRASLASPIETASYVEKHYISREFAEKHTPHALLMNEPCGYAVMLCEEDHMRLQCILPGLALEEAYTSLCKLDDLMDEKFAIAYDDTLGYLTHCPTNLGTGMRASVMMFLPGLVWSKELPKIVPELKKLGLTVRGVFGEGSTGAGYSYQVSNERTLGVSEKQILDSVNKRVLELCELELHARARMLEKQEMELRDKCLRAYGTLCNCTLLPIEELTTDMVKIKLGIALGFFKVRDMRDFNDFLADMRPASFVIENELQHVTEKERDACRAEIVGKVLPELVSRIR